MRNKIIFLMLCMGIGFYLSACSSIGLSTIEIFSEKVESGDYLKAVEIYNEKIYGNAQQELDARHCVKNYIEQNLNGYIEEILDENQIAVAMNVVEKIVSECNIGDSLSTDMEKKYLEVKSSKEAFQEAEKYTENGMYLEALNTYKKVTVSDYINYDVAQQKEEEVREELKNSILQEAEETAVSKTVEAYISAYKVIEAGIKVYGEDEALRAVWSSMLDEALLAMLQQKLDSGAYEAGLELYENIVGEAGTRYTVSEEIIDLLEQCKDEYRETLTASSMEAYKMGDFDNAYSIICSGDKFLNSDMKLQQYKEAYASCKPVALKDVIVISEEKTLKQSEIKDLYGNLYSDGYYRFQAYGAGGIVREPENSYYVGRQYERFSGTIFLDPNESDKSHTAHLEIYADDRLVYMSEKINRENKAVLFDVEIKNADKLTLIVKSSNGNYAYCAEMILTNAMVYNVLDDGDFEALQMGMWNGTN